MKVLIGKPPGPRSKKVQKVSVRIDPWDTWSMDYTLAPLVLPMLQQLKIANHGAPFVDDVDVPEGLRSTSAAPKKHEHDVDELHFSRWAWVMDEMIFAFETKLSDDYLEKNSSIISEYVEGKSSLLKKHDFDWVAIKELEDRMQNGFVLFGKYFQALWD